MKLKVIKELEVTHLICSFEVSDWSDSKIDGMYDDEENPKMPCINRDQVWRLEIDPKTGRIENWPKGRTAQIRYRVCDECHIEFTTDDHAAGNGDVTVYDGYVPDFLDTYGEGYGDYLIFDINEDGVIEDWLKYKDTVDLTGMED